MSSPDAEGWSASLDRVAQSELGIPDQDTFPVEAMDRLREEGVLCAPLPRHLGGSGIGTEPGQGRRALAFFHRLGRLSLPLGRLVEAHVNAVRIIVRYGTKAQCGNLAGALMEGDLLGLWVTDPPTGEGLTVTWEGSVVRVSGRKMFCSGAGHVQSAIMTAQDDVTGDWRLLLLPLDGSETVLPLPAGLGGMRAAVTGQLVLKQRILPASSIIGEAGDYLKEPDFSGGAWRSSAVALGGLYRLLELTASELKRRGRDGDPHQRARFGQLVMAHESGWLWLERAAVMAEDLVAPSDEIVATVGLARLAVEKACLDGLTLVHRSLGLSAFLTSNPVERLTRDLQTYLRQPAADEVLDGAAAFFLGTPPHSREVFA